MNMNNEKMQINLPNGCNEVVIREGDAPALLPIKAPIAIAISGTIESPFEFIGKRIGEFDHKRAHIIVNREKVTITLTIHEDDPYLHGTIKGSLQFHPKFLDFGINTGKSWQPEKLGLFIKMNRAFFIDKATNMQLVTTFLNFKAAVNAQVERDVKMNGSRTDNYGQVVNSNMPESFTLVIPIFKGKPAEKLEIETFANIDGRDVEIVLLSPGAEYTLETIRDAVIDEQLDKIREIAPDIVIIEE